MPSLWKKHKGNRISRLVADFQTPPKRGGSLVVETGFPTSIVDLFVKNRDRLKKPSKKKHRLNQQQQEPIITTESENPFDVLHEPVSNDDSHVYLSKLDVPSCSIDEKNQEFVAHESNFDLYDEEIVAQKNPNVELNHDVFVKDGCENDVGMSWGLLNSKKMIGFSILKGVLVMVVALYTKKVVVGITLGAFLLLLFEYLGNLVFGFSRVSKVEKQGERGVVSSKKEVENNVNSERGTGNGIALMGFVEEDGSSKGEINQGNGVVKESSCLDEEVGSKTVCEIEVLEPNACNGDGRVEYCEPRSKKGVVVGGEKEGECSKVVDHNNGKVKKGKKFWKKLVPKHYRKKKKHKQKKEEEHENNEMFVKENTYELMEEEDDREEEEDDQEIVDGDQESSFSSTSDEVDCVGTEPSIGSVNHSGMLENDNKNKNKKRVMNVKAFAIVGIVLAGLIQGRVLALGLTVICCLVFKMIGS